MSLSSFQQNHDLAVRHRRLLFGIRRSIRYHDLRRNHYLGLRSWFTFLSLALGSASVVLVLSSVGMIWMRWMAPAVIALISAADLAIGTTRKAALHSDLCSQFARLEKRFLSSEPISEQMLDDIESERLDIEMDEPATYQALNRTCHNELLRAEGQADKIEPLGPHHRALKNIFRFEYLPSRTTQSTAA